MHPNTLIHIEKIDASVTWLARWGAADSTSLCRAASHLTGIGEPSTQARHWAQFLVREGFAECVNLSDWHAGSRKVFIATRTARIHASALGHTLTDPYRLNRKRLAHRLMAQRALLDLIEYVRRNGGILLNYTTEPEISAASRVEYLERWPDAIASFELADSKKIKVCIEVERYSRSSVRLDAMMAGLAELLKHPAAMHHMHSALILCSSPAIANRYRAAATPGLPYQLHARRGLQSIPGTSIAHIPPGIEVMHGWKVTAGIAEKVTCAQEAYIKLHKEIKRAIENGEL